VLADQVKTKTSEDISLKLEWLAHAPRYKGMVRTYIWRPYIQPPETVGARIRIRIDDQGSRNVLVHLWGWHNSKGALDIYKQNSFAGPSTRTTLFSNPEREIQLHQYAVLKQLIVDSNDFVETAYEEVARLVRPYPNADIHSLIRSLLQTYAGRKSPENEKLYFLLHFGDCCSHASSGLAQATTFLEKRLRDQFLRASQGEGLDEPLETWFGQALQDIGTLRGQLGEIETQISATRIMIKDQLDLRTGRRTALVGVLAAIYIPFAFLSSLFGMNIKDPIWGPIIPQGFEHELSDNSSALDNSTTAIARNQTEAITSAISTSGAYLWSFKIYWIIAAPVTFVTILLPLVAGPTARNVFQFFYHKPAYLWTILIFLGFVGEIALAVANSALVYLYIFGIAYGALALFMLLRASITGHHSLLWSSFTGVYAYSFLLDLNNEHVERVPVTGLIPLIFLIIVLLRSQIRRLLLSINHGSIAAHHFSNASTRRQLCWTGIILYYVLVSLLVAYAPSPLLWEIIIIPLLILAINQLVQKLTHGVIVSRWTCYTVLLLASALIDWFTILWLLPYLPPTFILSVWVYQEHNFHFISRFRRIRDKFAEKSGDRPL
ncbi:MAG: hypothetical protein Q9209_007915, partial [Squamulea sp. 1 TL-2023]